MNSFTETRRKKKIARILRVLAIVVALYTLSAGWALTGSHFNIRRIEFFGLNSIHEDELLKKLPFRRGDNLLVISTDEIENAILSDRRIETVDVRKSYPDGIIIEVVEKTPMYLLNCGEIWGLTQKGEAIPIDDIRRMPSLPIVDACMHYSPKPFYKVNDSEVLRSVSFLNMVSSEHPEFLDRISEINSPINGEFELTLIDDGVLVRIADKPDDLDRLAIIIDNIGEDSGKTIEIDLRFPNQGIVKYMSDNDHGIHGRS